MRLSNIKASRAQLPYCVHFKVSWARMWLGRHFCPFPCLMPPSSEASLIISSVRGAQRNGC